MHALQPMQTSLSRSTMPSARLCRATTGQIVTHGALVHWLQRSTAKWRRTCGNVPTSVYLTQVRKSPSGTSFSDLQATVQAWQPMQRRWSRTNPYCMGERASTTLVSDRSGGRCPDRCAGSVRRDAEVDRRRQAERQADRDQHCHDAATDREAEDGGRELAGIELRGRLVHARGAT